MRPNSFGPTGSQTWNKNSVFDEAGYNTALADWYRANPNAPQPAPVGQGSTVGGRTEGTGPTERVLSELNSQDLVSGSGSPTSSGNSFEDTVANFLSGNSSPTTSAFQSLINAGKEANNQPPSRDQFTRDQWEYRTTLSPEQQALYDANVKSQLGQASVLDTLTGRVQETANTPIDYSGLPPMQGGIADAGTIPNLDTSRSTALAGASDKYAADLAARSQGDNFAQQLADAMYSKQTRYLDPQMARARDELNTSLADQGFNPDTPGYNRAFGTFGETSNQAYGDARDSSVIGGYDQANKQTALQTAISQLLGGQQGQAFQQELGAGEFGRAAQQQQFGQNQAQATFGNQARSQALQELLGMRNQPLNELIGMRSGTQVQTPSNAAQYNVPSMPGVDVMGAYNQQYQGQLGAANANTAQNNQMLSLLGTLGGAALGGPMGAGLGSQLSGLFSGLGSGGGTGLTVPAGFTW